MWVKICANTNLADALAAAHLGADAVGFVFAPSSRQVTVQQVRAIGDHLPASFEKIGVFANLSAQEIASTAETAHLTGVQLHDGFHPSVTLALRKLLPPHIQIIETAHWRVGEDGDSRELVTKDLGGIAALPPSSHGLQRALIDAKAGGVSGGLGIPFDWSAAVPVFASQPTLALILAGGLNPENVAEAVHAVRPWGVDVASGVESSPGRKDHAKLAAFIENARRA